MSLWNPKIFNSLNITNSINSAAVIHSEPSETYLDIAVTAINKAISIIIIFKSNNPRTTPADAATPFPPLNPM